MYKDLLSALWRRPEPFAWGGVPFWDDEHISGHMLKAHLAPEVEAASRRHAFIRLSAKWIAGLSPGGALLDLGCGPGLYAECFHKEGLSVTGMDISPRSIAHARASAQTKGKSIRYLQGSYLDISFENAFDIVTLIYCDFGVLPPASRVALLRKIHRALKPGGVFVVDVWTKEQYRDFEENMSITLHDGGFWSPERYACVERRVRYGETVFLEQYQVVTENRLKTYNIWNEAFDEDELSALLHDAGFEGVSFYANVCGEQRCAGDKTLCPVAKKL